MTHFNNQSEADDVLTVLDLTARGLQSVRLRAMVMRWRDELKRSGRKRKRAALILAAVREGWDDLDDIAEQTGVPKRTVYRDLGELAKSGQIEIRRTPGKSRPKNKYLIL